jgi:hypothetical protein
MPVGGKTTSGRAGVRDAPAQEPADQLAGRRSPAQHAMSAAPGSPTQVTSSQADQAAIELLLRLEEQAREISDLGELQLFIVNQTRRINRARQIFLFQLPRYGEPKVAAVSGLSSIDPTSMLIADICSLVKAVSNKHRLTDAVDFTLPAFCDPDAELAKSYPFREFAWVSFMSRQGTPFAGLLMARETVWGAADLAISKRLCGTYAHAWRPA